MDPVVKFGDHLGGGVGLSGSISAPIPRISSKSDKYCCDEFGWIGDAATAAQTVRMDDLLCQECVEVVFIQHLMSCDGLRL